MKFTEITVHTSTEGSELISDIFWRYTGYGVAISDAADVIALQRDKAMYWDYIDDGLKCGGGDVLVKAFVTLKDTKKAVKEINADVEQLKENAAGYLNLGSLEITLREVEGDDWIEIWRKHFRPFNVGKRIVICPEWIEYSPKTDEQVVKLDSNMAFGTGEHETTSMCLELLQEYIKGDSVCVDVGCGSGILGISAIKLGARYAYLTDIDTVAVDSAKHNAEINGVAEKLQVIQTNLVDGAAFSGDIILANITAEILIGLATHIPKFLNDGGILILSGIIESRLEMVLQSFTAQNLVLDKKVKKGEWLALTFKKL